MDFDEDPLDLLEDDGDGVTEMALFFDDDKEIGHNKASRGNSGCSIAFLFLTTTFVSAGIAIFNLITS